MQDTMLITDSGCDLSLDVLRAAGVEVLFFPYTLNGEDRFDDFGLTLTCDDFYDALRAGASSTTSQVRPADCRRAFEQAYALGKTALYVTISSGLSGSYETALTARNRFLKDWPDADIHVVDSLSVSAGQALLVLEMAGRLNEGMSAEAVVTWAERNRLRVNHLFTVDSFEYLVRGGRISAATGAAGSILNIKPILHVNAEGCLAPLKKIRGRHKALEMLADMVAEHVQDPEEQTIVLDHAQCPDDATVLKGMLADRFTAGETITDRIGVIIGTHTGPGGLVVGFWGRPRGT
jgi:DegV family protein with EDD domain